MSYICYKQMGCSRGGSKFLIGQMCWKRKKNKRRLAMTTVDREAGNLFQLSECLAHPRPQVSFCQPASEIRDPQRYTTARTTISELPPTLYRPIPAFFQEALHVDNDLVEPLQPFCQFPVQLLLSFPLRYPSVKL